MDEPKIVFIQDNKQVEEIDFGIVPMGQIKRLDIIVKNIGDSDVSTLIFEKNHPDITIVEAPKELKIKEEGRLIMDYSPVFQTDKGLKAKIKIRGIYVV